MAWGGTRNLLGPGIQFAFFFFNHGIELVLSPVISESLHPCTLAPLHPPGAAISQAMWGRTAGSNVALGALTEMTLTIQASSSRLSGCVSRSLGLKVSEIYTTEQHSGLGALSDVDTGMAEQAQAQPWSQLA